MASVDSKTSKILVVAAHSDDEVLGCGGTIAKHVGQGDDVAILYMTDGVGSRNSSQHEKVERAEACRRALQILGPSTFRNFDFPDNAMDRVPLIDVVRELESFCREWGIPDRVYTHHAGDLNIDHRLTHQATLTCFRPQPLSAGKPRDILSFEVPSSTGWAGSGPDAVFQPNLYIDITAELDTKTKALRAYQTEMREWPHPRSIEAVVHLARYRGSSVGLAAAEAFLIERMIEI